MQLGSYRQRFTSGHLRRRDERIARRRGKSRADRRPAPIVVTRPTPAWNESHIQRRLERLRSALSAVYGWRVIRSSVNALREHLIKIAESAHIQRCGHEQIVVDTLGHTIGQADPCGGRIRRRQTWRDGTRVRHFFCEKCGREALA
jgi:hypothetical protein